MTMRRLIIRTGIVAMIGIAFGILLGILSGEGGDQMIMFTLFIPIWFIGIYYCLFPYRRWVPWFLRFEIFRFSSKKWDRFNICANLIGGLIFAFVLTLGWFWGLVKFVILLYRTRKGEVRYN